MLNRWVLSRDRKTATEGAEVTRSGRLFQTRAAVTGNARSPTVWSRVWLSVQNFAIVRHGVSEEIGPRQNKQTLRYLVDTTKRSTSHLDVKFHQTPTNDVTGRLSVTYWQRLRLTKQQRTVTRSLPEKERENLFTKSTKKQNSNFKHNRQQWQAARKGKVHQCWPATYGKTFNSADLLWTVIK